jgi:hypothetical protein
LRYKYYWVMKKFRISNEAIFFLVVITGFVILALLKIFVIK